MRKSCIGVDKVAVEHVPLDADHISDQVLLISLTLFEQVFWVALHVPSQWLDRDDNRMSAAAGVVAARENCVCGI